MSEPLGPQFKALPPAAYGLTVEQFLATSPTVTDLQTPLITLSRDALSANTASMMSWVRDRGMQLAPHGKTSMAPALWRELLDAGAWGITLATPWQVQVGRAHGLERIMLANALVDPVALAWVARELDDPAFDFTCWVDSVETVEVMASLLGPLERPVDVIVELGVHGGRAGARSVAEAVRVADAARASPSLRVRGVGGYEGAVAHDRSAASVAALTDYLQQLVALHHALAEHYEAPPIVTAGGSAYPDLVADALQGIDATVLLRSGVFQLHDEGFYNSVSPHSGELRAAVTGWARVVSRPEPGLAILDGGRRDFPFDDGLPVPLDLPGARITALNDQHAYLQLAPDAAASDLPVGTVVRLGISHPCGAMDRWSLVPVIASRDDPRVVDLVRTYF